MIIRSFVMVNNPIVRSEFESFLFNRFPKIFREFHINMFIDIMFLFLEFVENNSRMINEINKHRFELRDMSTFFLPRRKCFSLHVLVFHFWVVSNTPCFITGNDFVKKQWRIHRPIFFLHIQFLCYQSLSKSSIWLHQRLHSYPHFHLFFVFLIVQRLSHYSHLLAIPWTAYATEKHSISSSYIHHKPFLI